MPRGLWLILVGLIIAALGAWAVPLLLPHPFGTIVVIIGGIVVVWGIIVLVMGLSGRGHSRL